MRERLDAALDKDSAMVAPVLTREQRGIVYRTLNYVGSSARAKYDADWTGEDMVAVRGAKETRSTIASVSVVDNGSHSHMLERHCRRRGGAPAATRAALRILGARDAARPPRGGHRLLAQLGLRRARTSSRSNGGGRG